MKVFVPIQIIPLIFLLLVPPATTASNSVKTCLSKCACLTRSLSVTFMLLLFLVLSAPATAAAKGKLLMLTWNNQTVTSAVCRKQRGVKLGVISVFG